MSSKPPEKSQSSKEMKETFVTHKLMMSLFLIAFLVLEIANFAAIAL